MIIKRVFRAVSVPLVLILYGLGIVVAQPFIIKALAGEHARNSLSWQILSLIVYVGVNGTLIYSWYWITKKIRNKFIGEAQRYSGSSRSDRPS